MPRIVAGQAGGRRLRVPPRVTRPTAERVREALFSALDATGELDGSRVLDLYAGSGALGLEALSRGAAEALFVESDRAAVSVLRDNIAATGLPGTIAHARVSNLLAGIAEVPYDLVLADPPYAISTGELTRMLELLPAGSWAGTGSLLVLERPSRSPVPPWPAAWRPLTAGRYGETVLYRAECQ